MTSQGGGSAGIAGLTSDGADGVLIAGGINVGSGRFLVDVPGGQTAVNTVFYVGLDPLTGVAGATVQLDGTTVIGSADLSNTNLLPDGRVIVNRLGSGGPAFQLALSPAAGATIFQAFDADGGVVVLNAAGDGSLVSNKGIGLHDHVAQSVPRTLAQSVITAITDANAKTAVQTLANALSDIGALTLT